ncbi:M15 family metallopeptidase [Shewanella submarina]|uniref:M15 family metallopeptidase n=1 Tax=Shewanella submarina TaxID=2016376 RepID=A0ABV7GDL5_9GAMM|nr:M15 family metallopeptidase [Shewanella submarina]MCL1037472.1 M15 family metallopeptidase [Shewanella submarina]
MLLRKDSGKTAVPLIPNGRLYGLTDEGLDAVGNTMLTTAAKAAFLAMQQACGKEGIALTICSGHRSFERQLAIWNGKASGRRQLLDKYCQLVNPTDYTEDELVQLILIWSALPGCSRHHWGTDIDVFDAAMINQSELNLVPAEYLDAGPCHQLYQWLLANAADYGFYFPFQAGLSGVSPEPWHLSYFPESSEYLDSFNIDTLSSILQHSELGLKGSVISQLEKLVNEFVYKVAPIPEMSSKG